MLEKEAFTPFRRLFPQAVRVKSTDMVAALPILENGLLVVVTPSTFHHALKDFEKSIWDGVRLVWYVRFTETFAEFAL